MADRFYTPHPLNLGEFTLDGPDAHHLTTVRRFKAGDTVIVFNGDGRDHRAELLAVGKKSAVLNITAIDEVDRELRFPLMVAAALPKGDRADFLVEKLTELGVTTFVPLVTDRSVVTPKDAKIEKFARQVIEASKQCGRNRLMTIEPACGWDRFVGRPDLPASKFVFHTADGLAAWSARVRDGGVGRDGIVLAIGPEGGFTDGEVASALAAGWRSASLGRRVLRMETAAVAAAAVVVGWVESGDRPGL